MKLKDKKIELLRQVHTRDEMGITTTTLESMGTIWAYFRHLTCPARKYSRRQRSITRKKCCFR